MPKIFVFLLATFLFCCAGVFVSYADNAPSIPVADIPDGGALVNLDSPGIQKLIKNGEANLKEFRAQQYDQEQKQHIQNTQQKYREAVKLYQQQRMTLAKDALGKVQDSIVEYKSTDTLVKTIDQEKLEKLERRMRRIKLMEDPQIVSSLAQKAAALYEKAAILADDDKTAGVRKKLGKLKDVLEQLKQERMKVTPEGARELYIQDELDKIDDRAEDFDKQVYGLTQAKNLAEAKKKYDDFQQAMIDELENLKKSIPDLKDK